MVIEYVLLSKSSAPKNQISAHLVYDGLIQDDHQIVAAAENSTVLQHSRSIMDHSFSTASLAGSPV